MASLPAQSWSPFRQSPSIDPHHPMVTQSPYQHLHRPPLSRNSSTGSDVGGSYREGQNSAASLQQQHRQNQFAAFQGNQQLRHSPYATRSDSEYQHNLSLAGNHHGEGNNLDGGEDDEGNPDFAQTIYDPFRIKHRRRTSAPQLRILEHHFGHNPKPDVGLRKSLSEQLDMTPREVQVWFQNRRAKTKKLREKGETNPDGEEEDSPEFSGPLPSPPMHHHVGASTSGGSQDISPVDTPGFEARNVYDVAGYPSQQQSRTSFFPSNTSSFSPYPSNYSNPTPNFSPIPSPNESRATDYYQVAPNGRHMYHPQQQELSSFSNGTYSPTTTISPWPTKDIDGMQHQPSNRYHQSLAVDQDGRPVQEPHGVLADYELTSNGGNQRPVGEYSYGIPREDVDGFSPGSSNDEPASHHDYSSISSTNSRMYEQSRSLPSYPFISDLVQRGGPRAFDSSNEQPHHQQQQISSNTQQQGRFEEGQGPYVRRSSCPTGLLPTFDTLGLASPPNPPWSMSLAEPSNYVNTPTHLVRHPNSPYSSSNNFYPNNQNPSNPSSYLNPNTLNNQIQSGNPLASFTYPSTDPSTLVRRGSASSNLGTITETIFPTAAAAAGKIVDEEESEINSTKLENQQTQTNSSAGSADRNPQIARKARSQHNLRNPYPQEKRSPGSHERRALATEI